MKNSFFAANFTNWSKNSSEFAKHLHLAYGTRECRGVKVFVATFLGFPLTMVEPK